ncbi:hypothetical protein niasHS_007546 [Heterodera schachtii]|uniref:Uncharacterized protein n=1 Tax=Heterodera schachtii TaxID=97005 RepID=A0ABD2JXT9_HETSC
MMADDLKRERETAEFLRLIDCDVQNNEQRKLQQAEKDEKAARERKRIEEVLLRYKRSMLLPVTLEETNNLFREFRGEVPKTTKKGLKYGLIVGSAIGLTNALAGPRSIRMISLRFFQTVMISLFFGANVGLAVGLYNGVKANYTKRLRTQ